MSWFDEQIRYRQQKDAETLTSALDGIAGAVMGKRLLDAMSQQEIADNALEEVLRALHAKAKTDQIPEALITPEERMEYVLRPLGIMHRQVLLTENWHRDAIGPMLGTRKKDGALVALLPGRFGGYDYVNPENGNRVHVKKNNADELDAEAICFYQPLPLTKLNIKDLLVFMTKQFTPRDIILYVVFLGLATLIGLLGPLFSRWLFGPVLESQSITVLISLAIFMICYSIARLLFLAYQTMIASRLNIKQEIAVEAAVLGRMLNLPANFFKDYTPGELSRRMLQLRSLCSTMMSSIGTVGLTSIFSLVYLAQIFVFAPSLVVPSLAMTLLSMLVSIATTFMQMRITREFLLTSSKTSGMTYSMITGVQKIKLTGAETRMFARWGKEYAKQSSLAYNPPLFIKLSSALQTAITLIGTLVLYYLAIKNHVSVADYYAFNTAYASFSAAFLSVAGLATTFANIKPTLDLAKPIMEAEPEASVDKEVITKLQGGIELSNVVFRYTDDMPNVIDGLSLKITPGEYLAIVGTTGCGKSTLMRLLLGFEKPQKGAIYYDGKDLNRIDLKSLRRKIGSVMQDGKLFQGDIYSNIVITAPSLTLDQAWEAAEKAAIADDIRNMPMGMNTMISEGQGGISGGQKQRLMIARALAPNPKVLIFDEATSALDNVTQKKVSDAIDGLHCTRIVIAHRLSTIRHADRIIVLDKGKIAEEGTYEELIAQKGFFADLVARQRLDIVNPDEEK